MTSIPAPRAPRSSRAPLLAACLTLGLVVGLGVALVTATAIAGDAKAAAGHLATALAAAEDGRAEDAVVAAKAAVEAAPEGADGFRVRLEAHQLITRLAASDAGLAPTPEDPDARRCGKCKKNASWVDCPECKGSKRVTREIKKVVMKRKRRVTVTEKVKRPCPTCDQVGRVLCDGCLGLGSSVNIPTKGSERSKLKDLIETTTTESMRENDVDLDDAIERVEKIVLRKEPAVLHDASALYRSSMDLRKALGPPPIEKPSAAAEGIFEEMSYQAKVNFLLSWAVETTHRVRRLGLAADAADVDGSPAPGAWPTAIPAEEAAAFPEKAREAGLIALRGVLLPAPSAKKPLPLVTPAGSSAMPGGELGDPLQDVELFTRAGLVSGGDHDIVLIAYTEDAQAEMARLKRSYAPKWLRGLLDDYDFTTGQKLLDAVAAGRGAEIEVAGRLVGPFPGAPRLAFEVWAIGEPENGELVAGLATRMNLTATGEPLLALLKRTVGPLGLEAVADTPVTVSLANVARGDALAEIARNAGLEIGLRGNKIVVDRKVHPPERLIFERLRAAASGLGRHDEVLRAAGGAGVSLGGEQLRKKPKELARDERERAGGGGAAGEGAGGGATPSGPDGGGAGEGGGEGPAPMPPPGGGAGEPGGGADEPAAGAPKGEPDDAKKAFLAGFLGVEPKLADDGAVTLLYDFSDHLHLEDFAATGTDTFDVRGNALKIENGERQLGRVLHKLPFVGPVRITVHAAFENFSEQSQFGVTFFEDPKKGDRESALLYQSRIKRGGKWDKMISARSVQTTAGRRVVRRATEAPYRRFKKGDGYEFLIDADPTVLKVGQDGRDILGAKIKSEGSGHVGFEIFGAKMSIRRLEIHGLVDGRWLAEKLAASGE